MKYADLVREPVRSLPVYEPGRPIELVARELGLDPATVIKLASNENPLGPSPKALEAAQRALKDAWLYPDNAAYFLRQRLAAYLDLPMEQIVVSAGSNEIFYLLCDLFVGPGVEVIVGGQAFISYRISTLLAGGNVVSVPMPNFQHDLEAMRAAITERTRLIFLPNPNNPTGSSVPAEAVAAFARSLPEHVVFCYDEAYAEYQERPADLRPLIQEGRKIICTRTFSKIYGLAGFRLGYGYTNPELVKLLDAVRPPFNTGSVAQAAALGALDDTDWVRRSREANRAGLAQLRAGFDRLGLSYVPSEANFLLVRVPQAAHIFGALQRAGIIVRPVSGYGLPDHLRISVGTESQNARLLRTLETSLASVPGNARSPLANA